MRKSILGLLLGGVLSLLSSESRAVTTVVHATVTLDSLEIPEPQCALCMVGGIQTIYRLQIFSQNSFEPPLSLDTYVSGGVYVERDKPPVTSLIGYSGTFPFSISELSIYFDIFALERLCCLYPQLEVEARFIFNLEVYEHTPLPSAILLFLSGLGLLILLRRGAPNA